MKIITGKRRGKRLATLSGMDTRPTLERIKQAVFNAIQFEVENRVVLDLFAGSGQLGLEALSRNAKHCYFNDSAFEAVKIITKNISLCGFEKISDVYCKDYIECVKILKDNGTMLSLVFLDPPYLKGLLESALFELAKSDLLTKDALVVCEGAVEDAFNLPDGFHLRKAYKYSDIQISIIARKDGN